MRKEELNNFHWDDQIEEDEMSDVYSTYGRQEECIQCVARNRERKDKARDLYVNESLILQSYCAEVGRGLTLVC